MTISGLHRGRIPDISELKKKKIKKKKKAETCCRSIPKVSDTNMHWIQIHEEKVEYPCFLCYQSIIKNG